MCPAYLLFIAESRWENLWRIFRDEELFVIAGGEALDGEEGKTGGWWLGVGVLGGWRCGEEEVFARLKAGRD